MECDSSGQEYRFENHGIKIKIPVGAIPIGEMVHIEAAVMMYGPFTFSSRMKPVSPVLWLCFMEKQVKLQQPFEVTLPHCLAQHKNHEIGFAKANHIRPISSNHYHFDAFDGESAIISESEGTVKSYHCCFLCIQAKRSQQCTLDSWYSLILAKSSRQHILHFCVVYHLMTCIKVCKQKILNCSRALCDPYRVYVIGYQGTVS